MTMHEAETICRYLGYTTYAYGMKTLNARGVSSVLIKYTKDTNRKITTKQLLSELGIS